MEISVVILNWNGLPLLRQMLPFVVRQTVGPEAGVTSRGTRIADISEVVVADNGSTDGSVEWVHETFPDVRVIAFESNLGFAEGYNRAIDLIDSRFVVLLNSDVETTPGWLVPMYDYMKTHDECGALQPKILSWHHRDKFEYAGAAGGFLDRNAFPYCRGRIFDSVERDEGQYDGSPLEVTWASGAALMVRTDAYRKVGGLDTRFFAHMEEIDLCLRMRRAGYSIVALTESAVYHIGGASLPQGNPKKVYLNFRNNLLLIYKNLPRREGKRILLRRRLIYDPAAFFLMVAKLQWRSAGAVLKAHRDFRRLRHYYTPPNSSSSTPNSSSLFSNRNIVVDYYLKRKRT